MSDRKWVERYNNATKMYLHQCYKKVSLAKEIADCFVRECCENDGGYELRIISYNTFSFTAGYKFRENGTDFLKVFTNKHIYKIKL